MSRFDLDTVRQLSPLKLSHRLIDVLALLVQGQSNKVNARELNVSLETVKEYVATILHRLKLNSRTQVPMSVHSYHETLLAWDHLRRSSGQHRHRTDQSERRDAMRHKAWTGEERRRTGKKFPLG